MNFRTRDLMVSVLPSAVSQVNRLCALATHICVFPTRHCHFQTCHHFGHVTLCPWHTCLDFTPQCQYPTLLTCYRWTICPLGTWDCPARTVDCQFNTRPGCPGPSLDPTVVFTLTDPIIVRNEEDIRELRAQLEETIKRLDEVAESGIENAATSVDELKELESRLKDAVKEVQAEIKKRG